MSKKTNSSSLPIESVKHKDKRKNIPTEELRGFVRDEDAKAKEVKLPGLLYARDPSLDPQLVWKGKDQQDSQELTVPAVPIYIQEKIHPQAIIEDVRTQSKADKPDPQFQMFSDFNGIKFEDLIEFYQHESNWANRMILGDSLLSMVSLAEKEGLKGKVQMIYIDPPYGIKFGSNWQVSTRKRDVKDGNVTDLVRQPEQIKAFRDTWELGIHSYLAYWRDRLVTARELLTESGSVFVQIGDENVHLLRSLSDEIFGTANFIVSIIVKKKSVTTMTDPVNDYLLWYAKDRQQLRIRRLTAAKTPFDEDARFKYVEFPNGRVKPLNECDEVELHSDSIRFFNDDYPLVSQDESDDRTVSVTFEGLELNPGKGRHWTYDPVNGMRRLAIANRIRATQNTARGIVYLDDYDRSPISNIWEFHGERNPIYVVQTNHSIVERCILMTTDPGDLVLDPTCGSGTTAYVAEQWGRRWITIDTSRVALALARTRLMTGRFPYYLLSDSPDGVKKEAEITAQVPPPYPTGGDIKKGFVYKRVLHVTLKAIANNEEIDTIYARWQEKLEPIRAELNKLVKAKFEEWEVPREPDKKWGPKAKELLETYWLHRQQRQRQIDESIAKSADTELLYDQPYEDNKRIRVTGPFTVESLSPHRNISFAEKKELAEVGQDGWTMKMLGAGQFGNIIIDNLKKAGVQNTIKNERLKFDRLDVHAGTWIHAIGEYTEKDGKSKRVAVCVGPEHGTVGPELVRDAAIEAVKGIGFDLLIVCGFAFDPHVSEEAKQYGKLAVLPTRIHADLQRGDEFLKKTGAANLFTVFGEPDIAIDKGKDGQITVEIKGLDIYDPTTGQIRSNSTDDIACWFVDTDYNGQSFFVRHAYFTGADQPYDKLKRALKAEIDEAAWSMLYSTKSRPFDKPKSGKIAIKVINHYGDEVLKVYDIKNGKR